MIPHWQSKGLALTVGPGRAAGPAAYELPETHPGPAPAAAAARRRREPERSELDLRIAQPSSCRCLRSESPDSLSLGPGVTRTDS